MELARKSVQGVKSAGSLSTSLFGVLDDQLNSSTRAFGLRLFSQVCSGVPASAHDAGFLFEQPGFLLHGSHTVKFCDPLCDFCGRHGETAITTDQFQWQSAGCSGRAGYAVQRKR